MVAAASGTTFALALPPTSGAPGGLPGRKPFGIRPPGRRFSRLLVASAGAHAAGLAAFLLLQWREPAPQPGTPVEVVFTTPAGPSAPDAGAAPAGPMAAPAVPADAPMPDAPAPRLPAPDPPVPDQPVPDTPVPDAPAPPEPAPLEPLPEAVALPPLPPPTPAAIPPQPFAHAPSRAPARPAANLARLQPRRDVQAVRATPARAFDAAQNGAGPVADGPAAPPAAVPRAPVAVVDPGPVTITNPRFRTPPTPPAYPALAREQGQEGEALIRARLDRDGNPDEVLLAASSGFPVLDRAAMAAVRRWAFEPGRRGGEPVAAWVQVPVRFALR